MIKVINFLQSGRVFPVLLSLLAMVFILSACPGGDDKQDASCSCDAGACLDAASADHGSSDVFISDSALDDAQAPDAAADAGMMDIQGTDVETQDAQALDAEMQDAELLDAGSPATLSLTEVYFNDVDKVLAFKANGTDDAQDIVFGRVQVLDSSDSVIHLDGSESLTFALPSPVTQLVWTDNNYSLSFDALMPADLTGVVSLRFVVIDSQGFASAAAEMAVTSTPVASLGQNCDLALGFSRCADTLRCAVATGDADATCLAASAPSVASAQVLIGSTPDTLALRIMGHDDEDDVAFADILLLDAAGEALPTVDSNGLPHDLGRLRLRVNALYIDHDFQAAASVRVDSSVPLHLAQQARIWLRDAAGLGSEPYLQTSLSSPAALSSGASCDPMGGFNRCASGEFCASETVDGSTCVVEGSACPAAWNAIDLNAQGQQSDTFYRFDGSTSGTVNHAGQGSCGGGGPQQVFHFVVPSTGDWRFEISSTETGADTVLYVRSECAASAPEYELACNDDLDPSSNSHLSALELHLEQDQTISIVVDSYVNDLVGATAYLGPFTLNAVRVF